MLKGDALVFENLQQAASKANLAIHEIFTDVDAAKTVGRRDANNGECPDGALGNNLRSGGGGVVGVFYYHGNAGVENGL